MSRPHKKSKCRVPLGTTLTLILILAGAGQTRAQNFRVTKVVTAPPQGLSSPMREVLAGESLRVLGSTGPLCDLWLRKAVPMAAGAKQGQAIAFGGMAEGTLLGAIRFYDSVLDFRGQPIAAGLYTLRYALLPEDEKHQGIGSPQRDFLLLAPAADDAAPAALTLEESLDLSRKITRTRHPAIWSLGPSKAGGAALPSMTHQDDPDWWYLNFSLALEGGLVIPAALVVYGRLQN